MKILLQGGFGRMGESISQLAQNRKWDVIRFPRDTANGVLSQTAPWDAIIDFSSENGLLQSLEIARDQGVPFLSGTTGIRSKTKAKLRQAAREIPVLWAANFSFGVAIFEELLELLASQLPEGFDLRLTEIHRKNKKDSPSGTAKELVRHWNFSREKYFPSKSQIAAEEVIVSSIRAGEIAGIHEWSCFGIHEILRLSHQALNRNAFATGVLRAAEILVQEKFPPNYYSIRDLLLRRQ